MVFREALQKSAAALAVLVLAATAHAAPVAVPNGDFEDWQAVGATSGWSSGNPGDGGANIGSDDEYWANPATFGSGWQENNKQRTDGKYGLQHPADAQHAKEGDQSLSAPGNGNFIGFVNLTEGDGDGESISEVQSGVLGQLKEGVYTLNVAVGARLNANWEPLDYAISLVAGDLTPGDPEANQFGTSGGAVLSSASQTDVQFPGSDNTEWFDLELVLDTTGSAMLGADFAIRIDSVNSGDTASFTQANFDNVRLGFIPEPATATLASLGAVLAMGSVVRRRTRA